MTRGRKPTPTVLKLVAGEKRKDRINTDEPQPGEGIPACPSEHPEVQRVWDYTVGQLARMRVVTMADRDVLLAFCQAVVMHREASAMLAQDGYVLVEDRTGKVYTHPASRMLKDAAATIKAFGTEFGLTPAARTRIRVGDQKAPERNEARAARLLSS